MNEKTKAGVEATIELFKGFIRPLVTLVFSGVIAALVVQGEAVPWEFWAVWGTVGAPLIGERVYKRLKEIRNS